MPTMDHVKYDKYPDSDVDPEVQKHMKEYIDLLVSDVSTYNVSQMCRMNDKLDKFYDYMHMSWNGEENGMDILPTHPLLRTCLSVLVSRHCMSTCALQVLKPGCVGTSIHNSPHSDHMHYLFNNLRCETCPSQERVYVMVHWKWEEKSVVYLRPRQSMGWGRIQINDWACDSSRTFGHSTLMCIDMQSSKPKYPDKTSR